MKNNKSQLDFHKILHDLKHFLPAQAPLKDFVHHNTLHAFQQDFFQEALVKANRIFGYKTFLRFKEYKDLLSTGKISYDILEKIIEEKKPFSQQDSYRKELFEAEELDYSLPRIGLLRENWKSKYHIDLDAKVHPFLFRIISNYLDQGIAIWNFPENSSGFLKSIIDLENNSFSGIFKSKRVKKIIQQEEILFDELLAILLGDEKLFEHYLFDQQFAHPGWSGMVAFIEDNPHSLLDVKKISLGDLIKLELLLEIDALDTHFSYSEKNNSWLPLNQKLSKNYSNLFSEVKRNQNDDLKNTWQEAFEWTFYNEVLFNIKHQDKRNQANINCTFKAVLCIDDRECSLRRHLEQEDKNCETYGTAGHFNVEFYFQPENGKFYTKVCPAPVTPKFLIKESNSNAKKKKDFHFNKRSHSLLMGWFLTHTIGFWSGIRLAFSLFNPKINASTSSSSLHMDPNSTLSIENQNNEHENGLQIGFSIEEMANRVEGLLKSIGMTKDFSSIVYFVGHGSTSVNNTHYAGYDCGACSGRPGSVNARVISNMANNMEVREILRERSIDIPLKSQFIGALHDTTRDEISFFDTAIFSEEIKLRHQENVLVFQKALSKNAKERSRKFASIDSTKSEKIVHKAIKKRSVSLFEPRPELNHATNSLAIVGRRDFTKQLFLDRRSFLNSYDYSIDPEGKYLSTILNAVAPVCGGINLEYYFSRVDNYNLGAGTKLPHNVMGLIGVSNGTDGDLRTGLPRQMIEVHDPIRLLVIVEHFPEIVLKAIKMNAATYNWFDKNWIHLVVCDPESKEQFLFKDSEFTPYHPLDIKETKMSDLSSLFEREQDNLPIIQIQAQ
jgi:uncharacterized protein YbcC (UPF0753/DUF2309 family)